MNLLSSVLRFFSVPRTDNGAPSGESGGGGNPRSLVTGQQPAAFPWGPARTAMSQGPQGARQQPYTPLPPVKALPPPTPPPLPWTLPPANAQDWSGDVAQQMAAGGVRRLLSRTFTPKGGWTPGQKPLRPVVDEVVNSTADPIRPSQPTPLQSAIIGNSNQS